MGVLTGLRVYGWRGSTLTNSKLILHIPSPPQAPKPSTPAALQGSYHCQQRAMKLLMHLACLLRVRVVKGSKKTDDFQLACDHYRCANCGGRHPHTNVSKLSRIVLNVLQPVKITSCLPRELRAPAPWRSVPRANPCFRGLECQLLETPVLGCTRDKSPPVRERSKSLRR